MVAQNMVSFVLKIKGDHDQSAAALGDFKNEAEEYFKPFLEGMRLEGSYHIRIPCYSKNEMNPDTPNECMKGAPWVQTAQAIMGGDLTADDVIVDDTDNFHRVYVTTPKHRAHVNNTCPKGGKKECDMITVTVTENYYSEIDMFDSGGWPQAALEHKSKLSSRQYVQYNAGHLDADFEKLDDDNTRCMEINQKALEWGLKNADKDAMAHYAKYGKKLVMGEDIKVIAGPQWIWGYMKYDDNKDKTETTVHAYTMRTPMDYFMAEERNYHYCKLLSPYRALEWIYIDSQFDHGNRKSTTTLEEEEMFLQ